MSGRLWRGGRSGTQRHGDREALARDVVRYNALVAAGWRVLRFTYEQVMLSPSYVRSVLRAMDAEMAA